MTVIAFKAGRMACDALCVDVGSGTVVSKQTKIKRTKAGGLIGQSGDADARALLELLDGIKSGEKMPSAKALAETQCEGQFLCAFSDHTVWEINIYTMAEPDQWHAQAFQIHTMHSIAGAGAGGELALAFMRAGKSAKEAVQAVCEINVYCGPPIYEEVLHRTEPTNGKRKLGQVR